jgi:hypothetical protein
MSETVWILVMVAAWVVVISALSTVGALVKHSDRAQDAAMRDRRVSELRPGAPRAHVLSGRR